MKRIWSFLLSVIMIVSLTGCGGILLENDGEWVEEEVDAPQGKDDASAGNESSDSTKRDENGRYVAMSDIVFSSDFSEDLAVVALREDQENYYVIDKSGRVMFTIPNESLENNALSQNGISYSAAMNLYENGSMLFTDGILYDKSGKALTPAQVGATSFVELRDGAYLVAEKITSDYASTKKELGVLNMDQAWIVSPSEDNYARYYYDDAAFWEDVPGYDVVEEAFDFSTITNHCEHTEFVNGKAGVLMYNSQSRELYVSVIDRQGSFLFSPVKVDCDGILNPQIYFDGNVIVTSGYSNGYQNRSLTVCSYHVNGDMLGSLNASTLLQSNSESVTYTYSDGVIVFRISKGTYSEYYRQSEVRYYTCDFHELFADA